VKKFYEQIDKFIHSDHNYMTLAACKRLPEELQTQIKPGAGLLIRYFCELPDSGWPIFGTLGDWEIDNHFSYNIRRDHNVSFYLDWNPVAHTGERFNHDTGGSRQGVPVLLKKAIEAMLDSRLRDALAYGGAACHFLQDAVTFPEQQTLHRRAMSDVLTFDIDGYQPEILFSSIEEIPHAVDFILEERIGKALKSFAAEIRKSMISGNAQLRHETQKQSDILGAEITADILLSLLTLYVPATDTPVNHLEMFDNPDEENLPRGYFIDREDSPVFQGYAGVEGAFPRAFGLRLTPGLQLRLSATGDSEVKWKQGIVFAIPLKSMTQYSFKAMAYSSNVTGNNGLRLLFYNSCWEVESSIEIPFASTDGWQEITREINPDKNTIAMTIEFYSRNNTGTILLDHWQLYDSAIQPHSPIFQIKNKLKLALAPGTGCHLKDTSNFALQNEPVTCVRDNSPANITEGNEFVFDGRSFIEIPYHPLYTPLQVKGTLALSFDFCPLDLQQGEIVMAANLHHPPVCGWRLFLQDKKICVTVYNEDKKYVFIYRNLELASGKWHKISLELSPENNLVITIDDTCATAAAAFDRRYSKSGMFIGADTGAQNFLTGRLKNIRIEEA
jgi:laminin G domain protein